MKKDKQLNIRISENELELLKQDASKYNFNGQMGTFLFWIWKTFRNKMDSINKI
jgi:predicted DNA binding CopG/RHH family protein